jgi:HD-GYP domain-containing protein (c-di-GMP phosphodiesterase class II)
VERLEKTELNPDVVDLMEAYERVRPEPLDPRERHAEAWLAAASIGAALAMAFGLHSERPLRLGAATLFVLAFAAAKRIRFTVGAGHTSPTQLALIPMLLLLPTPVVPLLVMAGMVLGSLPDYVRRSTHLDRVLLAPGDASYSLAPALVLTLAGVQGPAWASWPIFLAALAAGLLADMAVSTLRERLALGVPPALQPALLGWVALVDVLLAPIGYMAAFVGDEQPGGWLLVVPLLALIAVFAGERKARVGHAIELGRAYRGTTLLLSDVLEADDEYTGSHSWGVVSLALEVASGMGLDSRRRRNVEFAALLHDVGKIAVPKEIINKPGPLSEDEWLVIKTHTVEGQRMLERVGGVLGEVGRIVRSSHESWDGTGYPDGLAGREIPIESCIVSCCDAFDAMTTDRSYRRAMPVDEALAELEANAGRQFHPGVVVVLAGIVAGRARAPAPEPPPARPRDQPPQPSRAQRAAPGAPRSGASRGARLSTP